MARLFEGIIEELLTHDEHYSSVTDSYETRSYVLVSVGTLPTSHARQLEEVVAVEVWENVDGAGDSYAYTNVLIRFTTEAEARAWWADNEDAYADGEDI